MKRIPSRLGFKLRRDKVEKNVSHLAQLNALLTHLKFVR